MRQVKIGSENISTYVMLVDEVDGSPKTGYAIASCYMQYTRNAQETTTSTQATELSLVGTAHTDYRGKQIDSSGSPGLYRFDWPDEAFESGNGDTQVTLVVKGAGIQPAIETVQLVAADGSDLAAVLEDTIDIQSRIPAALVGGRIDASAGAISADATAADNLEAMLDGTGGVTLSLGQLAIVASSNDDAIIATGAGTGAGIVTTGGATGIGFEVVGGGTSGDAIKASATDGHGMELLGGTNNEGFEAAGNGTAAGMALKGGSTGDGLYATSGWNAGEGIYAYGQAVTSAGLKASGGGAGKDINADEIDDILEDTAEIGDAGIGLTNLGGMSTAMADAIADAVWDEDLDPAHITAGTAGKAVIDIEVDTAEIGADGAGLTAVATQVWSASVHAGSTGTGLKLYDIKEDTTSLVADHGDNTLLLQTTIDNYASATNFTIADGSTHDDLYVGCMIIIRDNGTATNKAVGLISDYDGSTKNVTLAATPPGSTNWTMGNGDHVVIVAAPNQLTSTAAGQISDSVWTASVHPGSTGTGLKLSDIHSALPVLPTKNRALAKFPFLLVSDIDHVSPKTGALITPTRSIDGGAFAACANAGSGLAEVGNGVYTIDLAASDTNGSSIVLRFTATGADDRVIVFVTQPSTA